VSRSISVFGLGYVGSVTAGCLAHQGHRVIGVDVNHSKVELFESGRSPIIEPGLAGLLADENRTGRLRATADAATAVMRTDISMLCVGTPGLRNGSLDLGHVEPVCREIGEALRRKDTFHLVVLRSTVLPGTAESLVIPVLEQASGKRAGKDFGVCVNPEFTREGTAVADFLSPAVTVIGAADPAHSAILRAVYAWAPGRFFETTIKTAEMIKYVNNSWHAVKVSFANEIGTLAKQLTVDAEALMEIFMADTTLNIASTYLKPGLAFGGSCLPKDVRALTYRANEVGLRLPLLDAVLRSNEEHLERAAALVRRYGQKKLGMLGFSFKADTDDLRGSPCVLLVKRFLEEGRELRIWDENVALGRLLGTNRQYVEEIIPHLPELLCRNLEETLQYAELVIIGTRGVDADAIRPHLRAHHIVIDLVNFESARRLNAAGGYDGICW